MNAELPSLLFLQADIQYKTANVSEQRMQKTSKNIFWKIKQF